MSEPKPIKITMNKLVEDMERKNQKFRKFLEDIKSGKRIRTQPKLPGMKKGDAVVKTVAAKLKKASKAHAGQARALENVVKKKGGGLMDYYKDIL